MAALPNSYLGSTTVIPFILGDPEAGINMLTNIRIQNRIDTPSNWESSNPILLSGEIGAEYSGAGYKLKVGNGATNWNNLPYISGSDGGAGSNIKIDFSFASGATTATYANAAITPNHAVSSIMYTTGRENMTGNVTWETNNGSIALTFPATAGRVTGSLILIYTV